MSEALAAHNVAAIYPDDETAKGAVFALRREGIAGASLAAALATPLTFVLPGVGGVHR